MILALISFGFVLLTGFVIMNLLLDAKKLDAIEKVTLSLALSVSFYSISLFILNIYFGIPVTVWTLFISLFLLFVLFLKQNLYKAR